MNNQTNCSFQFNKALDADFLHELFADDLSCLIGVFKDFLQEMAPCFDEIQNAFCNNDLVSLRAAAHKGKTLFAYVGLTDISTQLKTLEAVCSQAETVSAIQSLVQDVLNQRAAVEMLITEEIKRLEAFYEK